MLVPVPELAAARACGDMFVPVLKECSTLGLCCSGACPVPGQLPGGAAQGFGALRKRQICSSRATVCGVWGLTAQVKLVKLL